MPAIINKSNALYRLDNAISHGRRVFVFDCNDLELLSILREELVNRNISDMEIWQNIEYASDHVLRSDMDEVIEMYRMYDFSDKVFVISDSEQFGSMFNYVKSGILSKEEMVDALLCKI